MTAKKAAPIPAAGYARAKGSPAFSIEIVVMYAPIPKNTTLPNEA
jgi:hypothetical protein